MRIQLASPVSICLHRHENALRATGSEEACRLVVTVQHGRGHADNLGLHLPVKTIQRPFISFKITITIYLPLEEESNK